MADADDLTDDIEAAPPQPLVRSRDPIDMVAQVKTEGMRLDLYLHIHISVR